MQPNGKEPGNALKALKKKIACSMEVSSPIQFHVKPMSCVISDHQ